MNYSERYAHSMLELQLANAPPERLATVTEERKAAFIAEMILQADKVSQEILTDKAALWESYQRGRFHPDNKVSRRLFSDLTGIDLGKTCSNARKALEEYVGHDVVKARQDRLEAEYQARQEAERAKNKAIEDAIVDGATSKIKAGEMISGDSLLAVAKRFNIAVHPRTVGTINKRVVAIGDGTARVSGKQSLPGTVFDLFKAVKAATA